MSSPSPQQPHLQPQRPAESMLRRLHSRLQRRKSSYEQRRGHGQSSPLAGGGSTTSTPLIGRRLARTANNTPQTARSTKFEKDAQRVGEGDHIVAVYGRASDGQLALLFGSDEHLDLRSQLSVIGQKAVSKTARSRRWDEKVRAFRDSFRRSRSAGPAQSNFKTRHHHREQHVLVPMPDPVSASYIPSLLYNSNSAGRPPARWQPLTVPSRNDQREHAERVELISTPNFLTELRKLRVEISDHYSSMEAGGERDQYGGYVLPPLSPTSDGNRYANNGDRRQHQRPQWDGTGEAAAVHYSRERLYPTIAGLPNLLGEHLRGRRDDYPFLHTSLQHIEADYPNPHEYGYGSDIGDTNTRRIRGRGVRGGDSSVYSASSRHLSVAEEAAMEAFAYLRECVCETKYVTAVFESTKGGLAPILADVTEELGHWLGPESRLLAAACEIHWSVPELFRSRLAEIRLKDAQHQALRDNNRRVLALYADRKCRRRLPSSFVESKTEECCVRDKVLDAFQGVYRRYYPELLPLLDPETVNCHRSYWTLGGGSASGDEEEECPLRPEPFKFLRQMPSEAQLRRKSIVALNMAVLRMEGDENDYDNGER